jgi:deazaflavin-dependent oxidoreductase (nitroreductase family)
LSKLEYQPNVFQKWFQRLPASKWGAWLFSYFATPLDELVRHISGGRIPTIAPFLLGTPGVTLFSIGAKSGVERSTPLLAVPYGEDVLLVASNWGKTRHPAWYYNLKANPQTALLYNGQRHPYRAKLVEDATEYDELWDAATRMYIGYDQYKQRTEGRRIPLFLLTPSPS